MIKKAILLAALCISHAFAWGQQDELNLKLEKRFEKVKPDNIFRSPDYYNWGGSVIRDKEGVYHLFYSRWKRTYTFTGWLLFSEIAHAVADQPEGPWKYKETVLKGRGGAAWDAITAHNPKVKYFEGKYYLYYIATRHPQKVLDQEKLKEVATTGYTHEYWTPLREAQRTGVAVASSLTGPWKRMNSPLLEPSGPITTLVVNPAICSDDQNMYYLIVKGDKPNEEKFIRNQAIALSRHPDGPFEMQDKAVIDDLDTEDMSLWYEHQYNAFHAVFHAHHYIGHLRSDNGLDWEKANLYMLSSKQILLENGGKIEPDRMERPFVYVENNIPRVLSLAVKKGDDSYLVMLPIKKNFAKKLRH